MSTTNELEQKNKERREKGAREILNIILTKLEEGYSREEIRKKLDKIKRHVAKELGIRQLIRNSEILEQSDEATRELVKDILIRKRVRSISGIVVVAVMLPPYPCPGQCIYCPQGKNAPKSYTGEEPAARRARMLGFNSYEQAKVRLRQLQAIGHDTDKVEVIIMGGTFPSYPLKYQYNFVKGIYDALNQRVSDTLEKAQHLNEKSQHRCVGLTIETRPDYARERDINLMLEYGATRVELGVQVLSDKLYAWLKRGHTLKDVVESTQRLKDSAYKIVYHMMPGFQSMEDDIKMFKKLFSMPQFRPDMLKIYPALVIKGTELYEMWKRGEYKPLSNEEAAELVAEVMRYIPEYVRVMRVQRDIPANQIVDGVTASNLRQLVERVMEEKGIVCREIRCREAGHRYLRSENKLEHDEVTLKTRTYTASRGREYFLSFENERDGIIIGYLRMRFPYKPFREEITKDSALIRELKVFGTSLPLQARNKGKGLNRTWQHIGFGKRLMKRAEEIAKDKGKEKIVVISAIGTREYYRKLGYRLEGRYMVKYIK